MADEIKVKLTRDQAISKLKSSRNRKIYIHANNLFETIENPNAGYSLGSCIQVNCPTACKWLENSISDNMATKVMVNLSISDYSIFIC